MPESAYFNSCICMKKKKEEANILLYLANFGVDTPFNRFYF